MRVLVALALFSAATEAAQAETKTSAKSLAKAKAKNGEEDGSDGPLEDDFDSVSAGGSQAAAIDPMAASARRAQFERDMVMRRAHDQHTMMSQFMKGFAQNMKMNVLADSQGDMPEDERQGMIAQLEARGAAPPADDGDDMTYFPSAPRRPVQRRHMRRRPQMALRATHGHVRSRGRMLNARRHRIAPAPVEVDQQPPAADQLGPAMGNEAANEEIEPPRPAIQEDAESVADTARSAIQGDDESVEASARRLPRRRRAFGNFVSPAEEEAEADAEEASGERTLTPQARRGHVRARARARPHVVTDELGRKMPLLDLHGAQEKSDACKRNAALLAGFIAVGIALCA